MFSRSIRVLLAAGFFGMGTSSALAGTLVDTLDEKGGSLAKVKLGWKVTEFIGEFAAKEETDQLKAEASGTRRFRLLPASRQAGLEDVVVYFKDNKAGIVVATQSVADTEVGSWSDLVSELTEKFGRGVSKVGSPEDVKNFKELAFGSKASLIPTREMMAWVNEQAGVVVVALFAEETGWTKKRIYALVLIQAQEPRAGAK